MKHCKRCGVVTERLSARGLCEQCGKEAVLLSITEQQAGKGVSVEKWGYSSLRTLIRKFGIDQVLRWSSRIIKEEK